MTGQEFLDRLNTFKNKRFWPELGISVGNAVVAGILGGISGAKTNALIGTGVFAGVLFVLETAKFGRLLYADEIAQLNSDYATLSIEDRRYVDDRVRTWS